MFKRIALMASAVALLTGAPAAAGEALPRIELTKMMGRWYEVARVPNKIQRGCQAGASEWKQQGQGFSVLQTCRKGSPDGPVAEWKGKAVVQDPATNAKLKMSFFGGLVTQEYLVLDHRPEQGWLIMATSNRKFVWLMSQKPTLAAGARATAVARIRQLGFDPETLEFPQPARS
jgi:apolipoprotein D and lipocalin family protein